MCFLHVEAIYSIYYRKYFLARNCAVTSVNKNNNNRYNIFHDKLDKVKKRSIDLSLLQITDASLKDYFSVWSSFFTAFYRSPPALFLSFYHVLIFVCPFCLSLFYTSSTLHSIIASRAGRIFSLFTRLLGPLRLFYHTGMFRLAI